MTIGERESKYSPGHQWSRKPGSGHSPEHPGIAGRVGVRLTAQVSKPTLVSLGSIVTTFYTAARALRTAQINAKAAIEAALVTLEALRLQAAAALYAMVGTGMSLWSATPDRTAKTPAEDHAAADPAGYSRQGASP